MTQCPPEAGQHETAGMRRISSGYGQPGGRVKLTGCVDGTSHNDTPTEVPTVGPVLWQGQESC
jgi:hypothetical protein